MRIAILTNAYPPRVSGGAARIASLYSELLVAQGHEVRVWKAVEIFDRLERTHPFRRLFFHLRDLGSRTETVEEMLAWKPDVLFTHTLTGCGYATPKRVQSTGTRWVHMLHDVQLIEPSGQILFGEGLSFLRIPWRWFWSSARKMAMGNPDAVMSPTEWLLDFHRKWGWFTGVEKRVIPNPIAQGATTLPALPPSLGGRVLPGSLDQGACHAPLRDPRYFDTTQNPLLAKEGAGGGGTRGEGPWSRGRSVVFVGRLDPDKGVNILLEAWSRLADPSARLFFIGRGSLVDLVKSLSAQGIEYLGEQPSSVVEATMRASRVVVVPSLVMENQPTVILEGLSARCRVVASDVGGSRETLGGAGTIVPPGNVDALASALRVALDDRESHEQEIEVVLAQHDPLTCAQRLLEVLKSNL